MPKEDNRRIDVELSEEELAELLRDLPQIVQQLEQYSQDDVDAREEP